MIKNIEDIPDRDIRNLLRGFEDKGFDCDFGYEEEFGYLAGFECESDELNLYTSVLVDMGESFSKPSVDVIGLFDSKTRRFNHYREIPRSNWEILPDACLRGKKIMNSLDTYLLSADISPEKIPLRNAPLDNENESASEFYSRKVEDGNLRWLKVDGKEIPYVLTTCSEIEDIGRCAGGLYFVAGDIAVESWQRDIVAYHESFCGNVSHDYAVEKEKELACKIGKKREYGKWKNEAVSLLGKKLVA